MMKGGKPQTGCCPLCSRNYVKGENWKSRHHILPKRYFGGRGGLFEMCRDCHNELEKRIPQDVQLTEYEYKEMLLNFIAERSLIFRTGENIAASIAA